jgi:mannose-6-phosphate isomerase-like protein (cupin superfamily)
MTALDPTASYVLLTADGVAEQVVGDDAFWAQPESELDRFGRGWLVSEYRFDADWSSWEMHPEADEIVYLLEGAIDLVLERPTGHDTVALRDRGLVIVPRGVWHTARVTVPSRVLHVTMGGGTRHRPVAATQGAARTQS